MNVKMRRDRHRTTPQARATLAALAIFAGGQATRTALAAPPPVTGDSAPAAAVAPAPIPALSSSALTLARKGDAAVRAGDFLLASRQYALAALAAPQDPVLREMLGVALAAADQPDKALPEFRRAVRLADDDPIAALLLQSEMAEQGDPNEAQALDLETHRRFSRPNGQPGLDTTVSLARLTARANQEPDSAILHLLVGDACQLEENWADADAAYLKAIHLAPTWSKPLVNHGLSQLSQKRIDAAIQTLTDAVRLDPANARAKVYLGDAELHGGHNEPAITLLRSVAADVRRVTPAVRSRAAVQLAQAYSNTQEYSKAAASLTEAQRLAPHDPTPSAVLGEVQLQAGNYSAATDAYQTALRLSASGSDLFGDRPVLYRALAEAQISWHHPDDALATLRLATDADPASAALWHRLMAQAQFDRDNPTAGQDELCQALDADEGRYPFDTLNAIAARGLLATIRARYQTLLDSADSPDAAKVPSSGAVAIRIHPKENAASQSAADRTRALSALADIACYQNQTADAIALRVKLTTLRTRATDWYLLAELYDDRAHTPIPARQAYGKALELKVGLSAAQVARATKRLGVLTGVAYRP